MGAHQNIIIEMSKLKSERAKVSNIVLSKIILSFQ